MVAEFIPPLEKALARAWPEFSQIKAAVRLSGGASQETWAIDAEIGETTEHLILRRAPGGHSSPTAVPLATEAVVIETVREAGARVPRVRYVLKDEDGAGQGYVMDRLAGETIARKILREAEFAAVRPHLARDCGRELARIHQVETKALSSVLTTVDGPAQLARYRDIYDSYDHPDPVFEMALKWLEPRLMPPAEVRLVHGDFRHGNLLISPQGLEAVLDWELAHLGDPLEDLGWICTRSWRFGVNEKPVGGFGALEDLLEAYAETGGRAFTVDEVKPWIVYGSLKWGIMCMTMYQGFRKDGSVERAAIGRRSSEAQWDLVRLILHGDL
ncbi:MAG: phosphotransferase family protein [Alphaproteobacteria bacterium]|nr:phosphotransferase family protein [Alphaproteobacteria bacterium]